MSLSYKFSQEEIKRIKKRFPKLQIKKGENWNGVIDIFADYKGYKIKDTFQVLIIVPPKYPNEMPWLLETGGRTQAIANKYGIVDLATLHCNSGQGNVACLCVEREGKKLFPPGSNLIVFIDNLVIPYLYGLSYFEKEGRWAPWGERSHGGLGILEYHAEDLSQIKEQDVVEIVRKLRLAENWKEYNKQLRKPSGERLCLCGSRRPFRICHMGAWVGLQRLYLDIIKLNLNSKSLFQK